MPLRSRSARPHLLLVGAESSPESGSGFSEDHHLGLIVGIKPVGLNATVMPSIIPFCFLGAIQDCLLKPMITM